MKTFTRRFLKTVLIPGMFAGIYSLIVIGSAKSGGFQLAIRRSNESVYPFGNVFTRQKDAIAKGQEKYRTTPTISRLALAA
jgi:hypothetical protein